MPRLLEPGDRPGAWSSIGDLTQRVGKIEANPAGGSGGGITEITSVDSSVSITDPTGPIVDLSVSGFIQFDVDPQVGTWLEIETTGTDSTSGRGVYIQSGGPAFSGHGIYLNATGDPNTVGGLRLEASGASNEGVHITSTGDGPILIDSVGDDITIQQNGGSSDILIKNTTAGLTHILATGSGSAGGLYLESGGGTFTSPQGTFGIAIEEYGAGGINIYTAGSGSDITLHTASGSIIVLTLPTSASGLPTGALWRDSITNIVHVVP